MLCAIDIVKKICDQDELTLAFRNCYIFFLAESIQNDTESVLREPQVSDTHAQEYCKKPWSFVPPHILPTLWRIIYWTSQVLTWLVLPMMQSYANAGDFTVAGKIKSALIENAIFYGSYLAIFVICLVYVAIRPDINIDG